MWIQPLAIAVLTMLPTCGRTQVARLPVPAIDARAAAQGRIHSTYASEYAREDTASRRELAATLLAGANEADKPTARYSLLSEARRIATETGDVLVAMRANRAISTRFEVEHREELARTLAQLAKTVEGQPQQRELAAGYVQLAREALLQEGLEAAGVALGQAKKFANRSKNAHAKDAVKRARGQLKAVSRLRSSVVRLRRAPPGDAQAHLEVGRFRCFVLGNWPAGLASLARGADAELSELAEQELRGPSGPEQQIALAKRWQGIAAKRQLVPLQRAQMERHAASWYARAEARLSGFEADQARSRRIRLYQRDPLLNLDDEDWVTVFRSADPSIWNSASAINDYHYALPLSRVPANLRFLRLTNLESDEQVIIPLVHRNLGRDVPNGDYCWNGLCEVAYEARHLGVYDRSRKGRPESAETKVGWLGWGFGHEFDGTGQAWIWNGKAVGRSVFEISVSAEKLSKRERKYLLGNKK